MNQASATLYQILQMYSQECSFTINDERSYFSQFNNLTFHAILALAASYEMETLLNFNQKI